MILIIAMMICFVVTLSVVIQTTTKNTCEHIRRTTEQTVKRIGTNTEKLIDEMNIVIDLLNDTDDV